MILHAFYENGLSLVLFFSNVQIDRFLHVYIRGKAHDYDHKNISMWSALLTINVRYENL